MNFKEQLLEDLDTVFFNPDEFAEKHTINGVEVDIVVDNDKLAELYISRNFNSDYRNCLKQLFTDSIMFYVRKCDLDFEPVPEQYIEYDGRGYLITDVKTDDESYTIVLGVNGS